MQNGQMTVQDVFDGAKIFRIPRYQRAYAWGEPQLKDFLDDLENQKADKAYFLGTILFQLQGDDGYFKKIDIVDGQQRLTTIIVFMKLLIDRLRELGEETSILYETYVQRHGEYKLRILEQDNVFFQAYILQDHSVIDGGMDTPSQHRLLSAKKYLAECLSAYSLTELQALEAKLRRARVLTYAVETAAEATLIFETTNDRGKGLTNLEKTKSFLMYKAYLSFDHPDSHLETIRDEFSSLYRYYEEIQDRIDEDSVLQYHFIAFEMWHSTRSDKGYNHYVQRIKDKVNKLIADGKRQEAGAFIEKYTRELRESFAIMRHLLLNEGRYLTNLFAIGRPATFYPLLIKAWKQDETAEKAQFKRIVRLAEIFTFKVPGISRKRSDAGRDTIYALARDFTGDFKALIRAMKETIDYYCDDAHFRSRLMADDFYKAVYRSDTRYLLWQYENHLRATEQPLADPMSYAAFISTNKKTKLTIEHIAPQHPDPNKLLVIKEAEILPEMTEAFLEKYLHCLGNLTFDPHSANASKSNNEVSEKMKTHFRRAPFKTQNELDDFLNEGKWDAVAVEARRQKIVAFALKHWDQHAI